jgi:hypothetical protein
MQSREKPHMDKYREIMNGWNLGGSYVLASLLMWSFEIFVCLILVE